MTPGANFWNIGWEGWQDFFAPGVNWPTATNPWNPTLVSELQAADITCLRFMDWNEVNTACVVKWSQRIPKTANHYNNANRIPCFIDNYDGATNTHTLVWNADTSYGVAVEWQIDLCNRVGADLWMNIPCTADSDYCFQLAGLIKSQLNGNLKIYVEWANEIWNWGCPNTVYARNRADTVGLTNLDVGAYCDPWRKYDVYASVRTFEQFEKVFGANSPRLVKVIAGQVGYHWNGYDFNHMVKGDLACLKNAVINPGNETFNAYAMAPYIGGASVAAETSAIASEAQNMAWAKNSLDSTGISLVCYEGGADNYPDNNLALTRDPGQEMAYVNYLTAMAPYCDGVFNQYCFYGGCWGLKHAPGDSASISPKWRGWQKYWAVNSSVESGHASWNVIADYGGFSFLLRNSVKGKMLSVIGGPERGAVAGGITVAVFNLTGRKVLEKTVVPGGTVDLSGIKKALYLLKIGSGERAYAAKLPLD